jgi:hypothetical protein
MTKSEFEQKYGNLNEVVKRPNVQVINASPNMNTINDIQNAT